MKSALSRFTYFALAFSFLLLNSCSQKGALTRCPDMGSKHSKPVFAKHSLPKAKVAKATVAKNNVDAEETPQRKNDFIAFVGGKSALNITLPTSFSASIQEQEFESANNVFRSNSNNKVSLQRNSEGNMVLHADSRKDLRKAVQQIAFKKPSKAMGETTRDVLALVGGILGIVSAATSPIPFVNFLSIFVGAGAIVLGILGWKSERRRVWSRLGVILGAVGISLAILFIILYFVVFGLFFI